MLKTIKTWICGVDVTLRDWVVMALVAGALALPAFAAHAALREDTLRSYVHRMHDPVTRSSCSAVMIAPERAMTAAHCLTMKQANLEINGVTYPVLEGYRTPAADIAVLIVPNAPCPCAVVAIYPTQRDEQISLVGYPFGILQVVVDGRVQGRAYVEDAEYLITTARAAPGMSGGGMFNAQGELVGIISATDSYGFMTLVVELFTQPMEIR